jgi:hypothetical protein
MSTKPIPVAFPPVHRDPGKGTQMHDDLDQIHARVADILNNHFTAIGNQATQIAELQKQLKALQKK